MSSDGYEDCWKPFSILYNKYFPNNYKTYIVTETKTCPYFDTIKKTGLGNRDKGKCFIL